MPSASRSLWRRIARPLGALLAMLMAATWWWSDTTATRSERAAAAPRAAISTTKPANARPVMAASAASAASAPAQTAMAAAAPPVWIVEPDAPGPRERLSVAMCELGQVRIDRPASPSSDAAADTDAGDATVYQLRRAWPRLVQHLLTLPDARGRATGWMLALTPPAADLPGLPDSDAALLGLVRLAQGAGDAWVMQQAVQQCAHHSSGAACAGVSVRQWLRLDDGNAIAWLALWQQEPAAADEALFGMARARSADAGYGRMTALLAQHWPPELPSYLLSAAVIRALGMEAAAAFPGFSAFGAACRSALARGDMNRRAACDAAASRLAESGRELLTRGMGTSIGRQLGWEPTRRQAFEAAIKLSTDGTTLDGLLPLTEPYSCAQVAQLRSNLQRLGDIGEVAYWQAWGQQQATKKPK